MPLSAAESFPLWLNLLLFGAAGVVVWFASARLTFAVDTIADRTGLDTAFAGMLLLGGITSLPEVSNVATSSAIGNPALAVNNLLGSAAINVLLLAIGDAAIGRGAVTGIVARPSILMMGALCMIALNLVAAIILLGDFALPHVGVGVGGLAVAIASLGFFWLATGYDRRSPWTVVDAEDPRAPETRDRYSEQPLRSLWLRIALFGAIIFVAGYSLSRTGDALAVQTGWGSSLVGFAMIGVATSLPELSTIVAALRIGRPEMAFGQVLGTNFINLSLILLADLVYADGPVLATLGEFEIFSSLLGAGMIGLFLVGLLERRDRTILRMGYDSAAVILVFLVGLFLLGGLSA